MKLKVKIIEQKGRMSRPIKDDDVWKVIPKMIQEKGLVAHQIEPYNQSLKSIIV